VSPSEAVGGQLERREDGGWRLVIPVRREEVAVEKRTVVYEEVEIRREMVEETQRVASEDVRPG